MLNFVSRTFNSYFASKLFKLIITLSIIPSLISLSIAIYNNYNHAQAVKEKINHQKLKNIALNGLTVLDLYRNESMKILETYSNGHLKNATLLANKSVFSSIKITSGGITQTLKGPPDNNKNWTMPKDSSQILENLYIEHHSKKPNEINLSITFSLPIRKIWSSIALNDGETLCLNTSIDNGVICTKYSQQTYQADKLPTKKTSGEITSWELFVPGHEPGNRIAFILIQNDSGFQDRINNLNLVNILFYLLSNLVFIFLLIQLLRSKTKPIDELKGIQSNIDNSFSSKNKPRGELESIGRSLLDMNEHLIEQIQILSTIRNVSEEAYNKNSNLSEALIDGLLNINSITACIFLEIDQDEIKQYQQKPTPTHLNLDQGQLKSYLKTVNSFEFDKVIHSEDLTRKLFKIKSMPSSYTIKFNLAHSENQHRILICAIDRETKGNIFESLKDITSYTTLAFSAKRREKELSYRANTDMLTGLHNRDHMSKLIEKSTKASKAAFMFIDLDNFKYINDTYGHNTGDKILQRTAKSITESLCDENAIASRFGGDEFNVFLENYTSKVDVEKLAYTIIEGIKRKAADSKIKISASIGIVFSSDATTPEELLRCSDIAMYNAKAKGKSQVSTYDLSKNEMAHRRALLDDYVSNLNCSQQLDIALQAKVDAKGRITGFEALSRFRSHSKYNWSTFEIISHSEKTGKILEIGKETLKLACTVLVKWREEDLNPNRISVNVSPIQLKDETFAHAALAICRDFSVDPSQIEFEITESEIIETDSVASDTVKQLDECGFNLAIDDFGTGYSCFSYISDLPFKRLKVDRSLTMNITKSQKHRTIIEAIIKMAHHMNLEVTVEGVELQEEKDLIFQMGANDIQGYFFSRPVWADEARKQLQQSNRNAQN